MTTNGEINLRRADPSDGETIARFNLAMAWETEQRRLDEEQIRNGVAAVCDDPTRGFYVVAEDDGRVVACLLVTYEWSDWRNGVFWWIQSVYVIASHRRQGIYRQMYGFVQQLAQAHPEVCGFRLYVERDNEAAAACYESLGMTETPYRMFETEL